MFPKSQRVHTQDFKKIILDKRTKKRFSDHFRVLCSMEENFSCSVVVSKKVAKDAVSRNKIKRRVRSLLRVFFNQKPPLRGNFLVFVQKNILKEENHLLLKEIERIL